MRVSKFFSRLPPDIVIITKMYFESRRRPTTDIAYGENAQVLFLVIVVVIFVTSTCLSRLREELSATEHPHPRRPYDQSP